MRVDDVLKKFRAACRDNCFGPAEGAVVSFELTRDETGYLLAEVDVLRAQHNANIRLRDIARLAAIENQKAADESLQALEQLRQELQRHGEHNRG